MKIYKNIFFCLLLSPLLLSAKEDIFIKNKGQLLTSDRKQATEVLYVYYGEKFNLFFHKDKVSYVFKQVQQTKNHTNSILSIDTSYSTQEYRLDMEFVFSNTTNTIKSSFPTLINHNYINQSSKNIIIKEGYQEITYQNIYEGIDLKFYFQNHLLKYDFIIHPHGNYRDINIKYLGATNIINDNSILNIQTPLGSLIETIPEVYQNYNGKKTSINNIYLLKDNVVSFKLDPININHKLIIDPWSTFIGGSDIDEAYSISIDQQNNTYVTGYTGSSNFPTTVGVVQTIKQGLYDAFITKLDTSGNGLWSTFYGGTGDEYGYKIVIDSDGFPYLVGYTNGNDLLVSSSGVFQSSSNGSYDSFILKLDSNGNFIWATYFGGSGGEFALTADIDNSDNIIIGGFTSSSDMPIINAFQNTIGGALDGFVAKFDSTGNLIWSTYCGGSNTEDVHTLKTDNQNNIIISGETYSSDFPTDVSAYQNFNNGNLDVFLAKYDSLGNQIFATYFGGLNNEDSRSIATDDLTNIYLVGYTESLDFPIIGSLVYQNTKNGVKDGFIAKFSPLGQPLKSTFIGGNNDDYFTSICISSTNALYAAGYTHSSDIPIIDSAYQATNNGLIDGFYYKLDTNLTPNYSTYIGGVSTDFIYDVKINSNQILTFSGFTSSADFTVTSNVFQNIKSGQSDAFVFQSDSVFKVMTSISKIIDSNNLIKIYPNPFVNQLNIEITDFNFDDNYQAILYSNDGKKIIDQKITQKHAILNNKIKSGNYLLVLTKNKQPIRSIKLMKQ
jgi:hypothetical protein